MSETSEKPHAWIQWKGTDVCADIHCSCGEVSHFDGFFMYHVRCPYCEKVWEADPNVELREPTDPERAEKAETADP